MIPDKKLRFYIRYNESIHTEFPSDFTLWLRISEKRFENRGTALTRSAAEAKAREIASKAKREIEFVKQDW